MSDLCLGFNIYMVHRANRHRRLW